MSKWGAAFDRKEALTKRRAREADAEARRLHRRTVLGSLFSRTAHAPDGAKVVKAVSLRVPPLRSF